MTDIIIGLVLLAVGIGIWWVWTHQKPAPVTSPKDIVSTVTAGLSDTWEQVKADLPGLISTELAQARTDLAAAQERAQKAEADLAATKEAHAAQLASVAQRVAEAVTSAGLSV